MSKNRAPVSWVNPKDFRAGAEWIKSQQHSKEPRDGDFIHAWWSVGGPDLSPFVEKWGLSTDMRLQSWCGVRLRLIIPKPHMFDPKSLRACPVCLWWMERGYPQAKATRD